jgi:hypothetical protein
MCAARDDADLLTRSRELRCEQAADRPDADYANFHRSMLKPSPRPFPWLR